MKNTVGHLKEYLKSQKDYSEGYLKNLIDKKDLVQLNDVEYTIMRDSDLRLDDENRYHDELFEFSNTIFDCAKIRLSNSTSIKLVDCIFLGDLTISNKYEKCSKITLDTVVIGKFLYITGRGELEYSNISLNDVRTPEFAIHNCEISNIHITDCSFALFKINHVLCEKSFIYSNNFSCLDISESDLQNVNFPSGQVDLSKINVTTTLIKKTVDEFNPFTYKNKTNAVEEILLIQKKRSEIDTLKFLLNQTDLSHSKRDIAQLKYLLSLAQSSSHTSRILTWAFGALIKPFRIVVWSLAVIFGFALIYFLNSKSFAPGNPVDSFNNALYFSGLTFTTIGYGDILPKSGMRGLAVVEGICGIALSGAYLVSLTRRYID